MLLFVMQAEHDEVVQRGRQVTGIEQRGHRGVDLPAVGRDLLDARARKQPALRPGMPRPDGLVVRVEQVAELRMELVVVRAVWL